MCFLLIQQGKGMDGDHKINPGDVVTLCKKTLIFELLQNQDAIQQGQMCL